MIDTHRQHLRYKNYPFQIGWHFYRLRDSIAYAKALVISTRTQTESEVLHAPCRLNEHVVNCIRDFLFFFARSFIETAKQDCGHICEARTVYASRRLFNLNRWTLNTMISLHRWYIGSGRLRNMHLISNSRTLAQQRHREAQPTDIICRLNYLLLLFECVALKIFMFFFFFFIFSIAQNNNNRINKYATMIINDIPLQRLSIYRLLNTHTYTRTHKHHV